MDGLIQSSTLPYLKIIHQLVPSARIYLVTQERHDLLFDKTERKKINEELGRSNVCLLPQRYYRFGLLKLAAAVWQFLRLWVFTIRNNISHIHCFCTPAGSVGYFLSLLTGKKLVLDSYEPHAETMIENGTWKKNGLAFKLLWWLEKKQSSKASYSLAAASGMDQYAKEKYNVQLSHFGVRPTCVDLELFQYSEKKNCEIRSELQWNHCVICAYVGKLGGIYLDIEVFDFFKVAYEFWGNKFRVLFLSSSSEKEIFQFCNRSGVPSEIFYIKAVDHKKVPDYLSAADFAITPVKPVPTKRFCSPIKDGEYWAMGLPVVIPKNISDDSHLIEQYEAGTVLNELSVNAYREAVGKIDRYLMENRNSLRARIRQLAINFRNYTIAEKQYENVYG
jgi:hypothetical protein